MKWLSSDAQTQIKSAFDKVARQDNDSANLLVQTIEFLDGYAHKLEADLAKLNASMAKDTSISFTVGPMEIRATLTGGKLLVRAYVAGIQVAEYYLEQNGGRVMGKVPAGIGDVEFELWWENSNLHGKARVCKSVIVVVCSDWAYGSVAVPGA